MSERRGQIDRFAVVDVETTGLYNTDRIVEVAVVTFDPDGAIVDEWDTLVNPLRDVGPVHIHRITPSMVSAAPTFEEISVALAGRLDGAILVAHNLPFDARMLSNEFGRIGGRFDAGDGFCTYRATGEKLAYACERRSIPLDNAHRALADVRATARLMTALTDPRAVRGVAPATVEAPPIGFNPRTLRRDAHEAAETSMPYLARLAGRTGRQGEGDAALRYMDLLDWAISDLVLTDGEHHQLDVLAAEAGLSAGDVAGIHVRYIDGIIDAALRDGVVDGREQSLINRAAEELGVDPGHVPGRIGGHTATVASFTLAPATRVCFTGSAVFPDGTVASRDTLVSAAGRLDFDVVPNVTKKGCDLLVAADPSSQSGKAKKARAYGVPVVSANDFLSAAPGDTIPAAV